MARKGTPWGPSNPLYRYQHGLPKLGKGGKVRRRRKSAAPKAPRRRRRSVGKAKRTRRARGTVITPKRIAKAAVVILSLSQGGPLVKEVGFVVTHAGQIAKEGSASVTQHAKQVLLTAVVPVGGTVLGPKAIDAVVSFASKGEPMLGKIANAKLLKIGA